MITENMATNQWCAAMVIIFHCLQNSQLLNSQPCFHMEPWVLVRRSTTSYMKATWFIILTYDMFYWGDHFDNLKSVIFIGKQMLLTAAAALGEIVNSIRQAFMPWNCPGFLSLQTEVLFCFFFWCPNVFWFNVTSNGCKRVQRVVTDNLSIDVHACVWCFADTMIWSSDLVRLRPH